MYPLKSSVEGPAAFWQESNQSNSLYTQDEAIQDFLNLPSDMESFMALGSIEEVTMKEEGSNILPDILRDIGIPQEMEQQTEKEEEEEYSLESNQSLIDEVESYLQFVSGSPTTLDQDDSSTFESNWNLRDIKETDQTLMNDNSMSVNADKIFDALTSGNVVQDGIDLNEADLQNAYTTSVVGKNGENVIIIIAAPQSAPASPLSAMSPAHSVNSSTMALSPRPAASPAGSTGSSSDYEWTPSPMSTSSSSTVGKARKKYQRKTPTVPPSGPYPKEKTERKKAQNRSAAYKYREKKKAEQEAVDDELTQLEERNTVLKKRMSDLEIELKCLKKLVAEVGLSAYL